MIGPSIGFYLMAGDDPDSLEMTIPATEVATDQAYFTAFIDFSDSRIQAATGFLAKLISGGGNINIYDGTKTTQFARDVNIAVDLTAGQIYFRFESLSSTVDNVFYLYANGAQGSDYGVSDTYGRYNAMQDWAYITDFRDNSGVSSSAPTYSLESADYLEEHINFVYTSAGIYGAGWYYTGGVNNAAIKAPSSTPYNIGTSDLSAFALIDPEFPNDSFSGIYYMTISGKGVNQGGTDGWGFYFWDNSTGTDIYLRGELRNQDTGSGLETVVSTTSVSLSTIHFVGYVIDRDETDGLRLYLDGSRDVDNDPSSLDGVNLQNTGLFTLGAREALGSYRFGWKGGFIYYGLRFDALDDGGMNAMSNNLLDFPNFVDTITETTF